MAKKKQIFIDVVVDDKGTTQRLAVDSDKLEKALKKSTKGGLDQQRQMRGAADMSSNLTKNFSKLQQGISGGIVPAYAELAARVFAVTAAFRFLQEAADTRNLIAGQEMFGAVMGTNYAGITRALQDATDGQLRFKEAAQATAIGTAAGLTGDQLEGLATAAKNVSFALGRDLTDSFNRLIRGVTKAEPELLDELGIILRLEPATEAYAQTIGKTAKDLNAFERSQAVANFVLDEAERKFDKIAKVMDEDAFAVQQFGKAFDDILNSLKVGIATVLGPVLQFLSNNISSLIALFGLLALPLIRSVMPNLDKFGEAAEEAATAAEKFGNRAQEKFDELSKQTRILGKDMNEVTESADKLAFGAGVAPPKEGDKKGTGMSFLSGHDKGKKAQTNADRILKGAERQIKESGRVTTGTLKGYSKEQVRDLRISYRQRLLVVKDFEKKTRMSAKGIQLTYQQTAARIRISFANAFKSMTTAAQKAAAGVDKAFKAAGLIGLALMFIDLGRMAFDALFPMAPAAKRAKDELEELAGKADELTKHLSKVNELRADTGLLSLRESIQQTGNAIKEANIASLIKQINEIDTKRGTEGFDEYKESLLETTKQLTTLNPKFEALTTALENDAPVEGAKDLIDFSNAAIKSSDALAQLAQSQKDVDKAISDLTNSLGTKPFDGLVSALQQNYKLKLDLQTNFDQEAFDKETLRIQREIDKFTRGTGKGTGSRAQRKHGRTQTKEDKEEVTRLEGVLDARTKAAEKIDEDAARAERRAEIAVGYQTRALEKEKEVLANKIEISEIDKVSQTFEAKKERLKIGQLNAENKLAKAQEAAQSARLAKELLEVDLKTDKQKLESKAYQNALLAVENADQLVRIEENNLDSVNKQTKVKEFNLTIDEKRLKVAREIAAAENALARARLAQERGTTAGVGTVGKSFLDIEEEKRQNNITNLISERAIIDQKIDDAKLERSKAIGENNAVLDQAAIDAANQRIASLTIEGEKLDQNLERARNILLNESERLRLEVGRQELLTKAISLNPVQQAFEEELVRQGIKKADASKEQLAAIYAQIEALKEQEVIQEGLQGVVDSIQGGMEKGLMSIVDGTKSAKEAFADFAKSVLKSIAEMIIKMMVFNALKSMGIPGLRGGGVVEPAEEMRYGGVLKKGYSTGGIARGRQAGYPVMLHGTEAVVPLPNKKEIPVEIRGGTGNQNNINITVATDGTTQQTGQGDNQQGANLGRAISAAVQDELQRQKRPGGILSPYGAA